jgi:P27 family predicted phage terminase small subunit
MGKRGPKPKPSAIRATEGKIVPLNEPRPTLSALQPPPDIAEDALDVWREVIAAVGHTGVITAADVDTLRAYCEATARYREAEGLLRKSGPLVKGRNGEYVKNPLHQVMRDNATMMRAGARELGLTPSARVGMKSTSKAAPSPLELLLARRAQRVAQQDDERNRGAG